MSRQDNYLLATRHPWPCLLFLLPLLAAYEAGVLWLGGSQPEALRGGVDAWLRWTLLSFGVKQLYVLPVAIAGVFLIWSWFRRKTRPADLWGSLLGMTLESVAFALILYGVCALLNPVLFDGPPTPPRPKPVMEEPATEEVIRPNPLLKTGHDAPSTNEPLAQVVMFVGAGIYEEVVFRLLAFSAVLIVLLLIQFPTAAAAGLAAMVSAVTFAAAHHVGPYGEPFRAGVFAFRVIAGLFFAALYYLRGFGVAVGAHACYDLLAGFSESS